MAEDVTKLVLIVDSKQVGRATQRLDGFVRSSTKAERSNKKLTSSFVGLGVSLIAVYKAYQALENTVTKVATFEKLDKQLEFLTGSANAAATELEFLRSVAQENALVTEEIVGPYTRMATAMTQLGLSAGDTRDLFEGVAGAAATFGMSADEVNGILVAFSQVASKGTVQAEELRNQIGERVPGAFQLAADTMGVTTQELNKMLEQGEVMADEFLPKFAAQLQKVFGEDIANKTDTLGAAWRRAGEALTFYQLSLAESSNTSFFLTEVLTGTTEALNMMSSSSKESSETLDDVWFSADNIRDSLITARIVAGQFGLGLQSAAKMGEIALLALTHLLNTTINTTLIGIATGIESVVNTATSKIRGLVDTALQASDLLPEKLEEKLKKVKESLDFKLDIDTSGFKDDIEITASALNQAVGELATLSQTMLDYPDKIVNSLGDATLEAAEKIRERLKEFNQDLVGETNDSTVPGRLGQTQMEALNTRYEQLRESLLTEEEAIEESYKARKDLIIEYSNQTGTEQNELMARLDEQREKQRKELQMRQWDTALSSFDDFQQNMLVLAKTGNDDIATVYKAAAIANTTIKTYEAATSAYAALAGIPIVGPALGTAAAAAAVAAGLANVSAIANQQVGNYTQGGIIPGNNYNGDNLQANVNSGEMILNYSQQKNLLDMANNGGSGGKQVVVNVIGAPAEDVEVQERETDNERIIEIAVKRAVSTIDNNIRTGRGDTERALQTRDRRRP